jgi:hypothetical protein
MRGSSLLLLSGLFDGLLTSLVWALSSDGSVSTDQPEYSPKDTIGVSFTHPSSSLSTGRDWIGITKVGETKPSLLWKYSCNSGSACDIPLTNGTVIFCGGSLHLGMYDVTYFKDDGYEILAGPASFSVSARDGAPSSSCPAACSEISNVTHIGPTTGAQVSTIAFGSCFKPDNQVSDALWRHMREETSPDLFMWVGDNMYSDGPNMESKRLAYNAAREDEYYVKFGPVASPKIPVIATWGKLILNYDVFHTELLNSNLLDIVQT